MDGLGEQSTIKIRDTIQQIIRNTKDTLRVRIRMENPAPADEELIKALYVRIHARPLLEQAEMLYQTHHKALQKELLQAKKALSGLGWLFKSRGEKQQIADAVDRTYTVVTDLGQSALRQNILNFVWQSTTGYLLPKDVWLLNTVLRTSAGTMVKMA